MKTLDEAGKVKFITVAGGHLSISKNEMKKYMVPYLIDNNNNNSTEKRNMNKFLNERKQVVVPQLEEKLSTKMIKVHQHLTNGPHPLKVSSMN